MLKTLNKESNHYLESFCKEVNALFQWKKAQIATKNDKNSKMSRFFYVFMQLLSNFQDSMDQNVENGQQRSNSLSNTVVWGDKCSFVRKKCHNNCKIVKKSKIFDSPTQFSKNFQRFHGLEL